MKNRARLLKGDCVEKLSKLNADSIDLIFTSPPYAKQRVHDYGGVDDAEYVDWWMARADAFRRVLKPTGSLCVNIKEHVKGGVKSPYVLDTVRSMITAGWIWSEEFIWVKKNPYPTESKYRVKDGFERVFQFVQQPNDFKFNKDAVAVPKTQEQYENQTKKMADARRRIARAKKPGDIMYKTNSGFGYSMASLCEIKDVVYPSNVLRLPNVSKNVGHSAAFPVELPEFFIKLFTDKGDVVLDPFVGCGSTMLAAIDLGRKAVGVELDDRYYKLCKRHLKRRLTQGMTTKQALKQDKPLPDGLPSEGLFGN